MDFKKGGASENESGFLCGESVPTLAELAEFKPYALSSYDVRTNPSMLKIADKLATVLDRLSAQEILEAVDSGQLYPMQLNGLQHALSDKQKEMGQHPGLLEKVLKVIRALLNHKQIV